MLGWEIIKETVFKMSGWEKIDREDVPEWALRRFGELGLGQSRVVKGGHYLYKTEVVLGGNIGSQEKDLYYRKKKYNW